MERSEANPSARLEEKREAHLNRTNRGVSARDYLEDLRKQNQTFYQDPRGIGALKDLQQTFSHPWIYIAELLQNAVDEGAKRIRIATEEDDGLVFEHDGRPFEKDDVEALCTRGVSTKGAGTVGFMGVGFKAVFCSFEQAQISSGPWKFGLVVDAVKGEVFGDVQRRWLGAVLPYWDETTAPPSDGMTCRFALSQRLEGLPPTRRDVECVFGEDFCLLALLAWRGLEELSWNENQWLLSCSSKPLQQTEKVYKLLEALDASTERVRRWILFSADYQPSPSAIARFLEHRQLLPRAGDKERVYQEASKKREVAALCELELPEKDFPAPPARGSAFALLPTGVTFPIGLHIQADWLLVVSRRELMQFEGNPWQQEILQQIPLLLRQYLLWLTSGDKGPDFPWAQAYAVLPDIPRRDSATDSWFNGEDFVQSIRRELAHLKFLPAPAAMDAVGTFLPPSEARILPEALVKNFDDGSAKQRLLFGDRVISIQRLGDRATRFLNHLNVLTELSPAELVEEWKQDRVREWHTGLPIEERQKALAALLASLSALDSETEWRNAELRCLPTETGDWTHRKALVRLPGDWNILAQEDDITGALLPFAGKPDAILSWKFDSWLLRLESLAIKYLADVQSPTLEEVIGAWWNSLGEHPSPQEIHLVLRLTCWVRAKQPQRKSLIRKLLCVSEEGGRELLPPDKILLAEPYAGGHRRLFFPHLPLVASEYLDAESNGGETEWRAFFEGLKPSPKGPFSLQPIPKKVSDRDLRQRDFDPPPTRTTFIRPMEWMGLRIGHRDYALVDANLPEPFRESPLGEGLSRSVATSLAQWMLEDGTRLRKDLRTFKDLHVVYIPYGESKLSEHSLDKPASWVRDLSDQCWILAKPSEVVCRPSEVLGRPDPARPDAPIADLPEQLVTILEEAGIRFGASLPDAPAVQRLRTQGLGADAQTLLDLVQKAVEEARTDEHKAVFLRETFQQCSLFPIPQGVSPPDGATRVTHVRLVRRARARSTLGGWLVPVEDLQPESPIRKVLEAVDAFHPIPNETTMPQVVGFLSWLWETEPDVDRVRSVLPLAYKYLREDLGSAWNVNTQWMAHRQKAKVFVLRERRWEPIKGNNQVFLDDIEHRAHESVVRDLKLATPGHLGETRADRLDTARLLGLAVLSDRFRIEVRPEGLLTVPTHWQNGFEFVQKKLRDRLSADGERDPEADPEGTAAQRPLFPLTRWGKIRTIIFDKGKEVHSHSSNVAPWEEGIAVAGEPQEFARELCPLLFDRWGLRLRRDLIDLLPDVAIQLTQIGDEKTVSFWLSNGTPPVKSSFEGELQKQTAEETKTVGPSKARDEHPPGSQTSTSTEEEKVAVSPPNKPGGGHTAEDLEACLKAIQKRKNELERQIQDLRAVGVLPPGDRIEDGTTSGGGKFHSDTRYRRAVLEYERTRGRWPVEKSGDQPGHDIDSFTHPDGDPNRKLIRRIEIKGTSARWEADQTVEMSERQFKDAVEKVVEEDLAASDFDYWLYVVEDDGQGKLKVLPIRNPAQKAARFEVRAGTWRDLAELEDPPQKHIPSDPSTSVKGGGGAS